MNIIRRSRARSRSPVVAEMLSRPDETLASPGQSVAAGLTLEIRPTSHLHTRYQPQTEHHHYIIHQFPPPPYHPSQEEDSHSIYSLFTRRKHQSRSLASDHTIQYTHCRPYLQRECLVNRNRNKVCIRINI